MTPRAYLFSLEQIGIKLGLEQIRALLEALGRPDRAFPSIVVAGTNGKGSVTAMVERAFRAAGYRTGRYTSPHLVDIEERFVIDGQPITPTDFDRLAARIREASAALPSPPSFFEATTALAIEAFREAGVNAAVLEVGLGGRLDATNAVDSTAVAITSIDFDHQEYLGSTLEAIAGEKAGVIKPGGLAVLSQNPAIVRNVVQNAARALDAHLIYAPDGVETLAGMVDGRTVVTIRTPLSSYEHVRLGLRGRHQVANAVTAVRLMEAVTATHRFTLPPAAIRAGLEDVVWPGRLEWRPLGDGHDVLIDGAHNPAGARALADYVIEAIGRPVPMVVGVMRDKAIGEILRALVPAASCFIATSVSSPRAAEPDAIVRVARDIAPDIPAEPVGNPWDAVRLAATRGNPVVVGGSLYLAGEIRAKLP